MSLKRYGKYIHAKYPKLHPIIKIAHKIIYPQKPKFTGWNMTTYHEVPWKDEFQGEVFRNASTDLKSFGVMNGIHKGLTDGSLDWRHWIVSTAIRYALIFTESDDVNVVECGVGDGLSAFILLRECSNNRDIKYTCHLYDSWGGMKKNDIMEVNSVFNDKYAELDIERTKKNLVEFKDNIRFHQGYIPESFQILEQPKKIIYMHIDVNSSDVTNDVLEFFYPRLIHNSVILFDDYGWEAYSKTKNVIDEFFKDKPGLIIKYPTGQAMYIHK